MLELAYEAAVVEPEVTVRVEDAVERGTKMLLELELELELAAAVERELAALVGLRGMVAMMLGMGSIAKMSLELLQQARQPGPCLGCRSSWMKALVILYTLL
jgi:hypothetical protein